MLILVFSEQSRCWKKINPKNQIQSSKIYFRKGTFLFSPIRFWLKCFNDTNFSSIDYHEDLKANLAERTKDITRPITDPNHVSKVHHVSSAEDFDNEMKNNRNKLIIVDFYATWCGPCKSLARYLSAFADKYESQVFIMKVDVDEQDELATSKGVTGLPTVMYFKDGQLVEQYSDGSYERMEATIKKLAN